MLQTQWQTFIFNSLDVIATAVVDVALNLVWSPDFQDVLIVVGAFNWRLIFDLEQLHTVSAEEMTTLSGLLTSDNSDQSEIPSNIPRSVLLQKTLSVCADKEVPGRRPCPPENLTRKCIT